MWNLSSGTRWIRKYDWDAVAGITAAVAALVLHLLHVVQVDVLLTITLVLGAIILLRQLRHEEREQRVEAATARTEQMIDRLLRPAIENPRVSRILFVLDEGERKNWRHHVVPKVAACAGHEKVVEPRWCAMNESVSFILADGEADGQLEAQLSFWGEPFMARTPGRDVPRYIFHVQHHSELIAQFVELERRYRMVQ